MNLLSNLVRPEGDPKVLSTGPSSLSSADRLARILGWVSVGLGATQLLAAPRLARDVGMPGRETLMRAFGVREIASGIATLSVDRQAGLISRVAGDVLDIAVLGRAVRQGGWKAVRARRALSVVIGITALDAMAAVQVMRNQQRSGPIRDYRDRSGFPKRQPKENPSARLPTVGSSAGEVVTSLGS